MFLLEKLPCCLERNLSYCRQQKETKQSLLSLNPPLLQHLRCAEEGNADGEDLRVFLGVLWGKVLRWCWQHWPGEAVQEADFVIRGWCVVHNLAFKRVMPVWVALLQSSEPMQLCLFLNEMAPSEQVVLREQAVVPPCSLSVFLPIAAMEQNGCFLFASVGVHLSTSLCNQMVCRKHCTEISSSFLNKQTKTSRFCLAEAQMQCFAEAISTLTAVGQIPPELVTQHLNEALWF